MGQKINPNSYRLGVTKNWPARWFFTAKGGGNRYPYAKFLEEDEAIRALVRKKISQAGIAAIEIERTSNAVRVHIKAARPGFVIGQGGKGIEELSKQLEAAIRRLRGAEGSRSRLNVSLNVEELKRSEVSAAHSAQQIAWDLEKRMHFRRVMKKYLDQIMQNRGARGAKILLSGRLGGAEIARRESLREGALPLQTIRADIDFGTATAFTTYGTIGVKVWVYRGKIFTKDARAAKNTN